jgi:peptidoglycan/LPS O-acetylase OafA/YrhL
VLTRSLTHADYLAMRRFPALDGLRAIAALMVVAFHFGGPRWSFLSGWIGVHVFFALSGFLITTLSLREEDRRGRLSLGNFYLRRIFRILPVYFVVLVMYVGTYGLRGEYHVSGIATNLKYYLTFMGEFVPIGYAQFAQSWTLGIEQKFYLLWPLLAFVVCAGSFRKRIGLSVSILLLLLLSLIPATDNHNGIGVQYIALITGALVAIVLHNPKGFRLLAWLTKPVVSAVGGLVFIAIHLAVQPVFLWLSNGRVSVNTTYLIVISCYAVPAALLIPTLLGPGLSRWLLSQRPLVFIGERSYAVYLVQGIAGQAVISTIPRLQSYQPWQWLGVAAVALIIADLLYRTVEQPMIRVGRRIIERRKAAELARAEPPPAPEPQRIPVEAGI